MVYLSHFGFNRYGNKAQKMNGRTNRWLQLLSFNPHQIVEFWFNNMIQVNFCRLIFFILEGCRNTTVILRKPMNPSLINFMRDLEIVFSGKLIKKYTFCPSCLSENRIRNWIHAGNLQDFPSFHIQNIIGKKSISISSAEQNAWKIHFIWFSVSFSYQI